MGEGREKLFRRLKKFFPSLPHGFIFFKKEVVMDILKILEKEFSLKEFQVQNTVNLIDEGNTIPFIARYRKELTGSLDDQVLHELYERLLYLRNLSEKREQTRALITEQGKMTEEIALALDKAETLSVIEDIYRPFRPKRRTRATIAKERGLEPLALAVWGQQIAEPVLELAKAYVSEELEVPTAEDAVNGALDIIAEMISDDAHIRSVIRAESYEGLIVSKAAKNEPSVYEMYYQFSEPVKKIAGHRILALNRGEKEEFLKVDLSVSVENILGSLIGLLVKPNPFTETYMKKTIEDSYNRLIAPSVEREIRNDLTQKAEDGAIKVFSENLKQLLLQAPIKDRVVLALDPGFRTGCKVAVIDGTGKVLATNVVYCTPPQSKIEESKAKLVPYIEKFKVEIIAIGNGTASRETESFVVDMLKELADSGKVKGQIYYVIVNEAGASVYSASKLGAEEFPDFDVALRSAVSIGRRLQDPMAELVKIDPKSIGVGQYQHDMNQKNLGEALSFVVESCVNSVGVDLNTASPSLLSYVAGINGSIAKNILEYREQNGRFQTRKELLKVKKLGPKAFEQCAGFLRIPGAKYPLDGTGVHPETYEAAEALLGLLGYDLEGVRHARLEKLTDALAKVMGVATKNKALELAAQKLNIGVPTLTDIIKELEKPGRDPRCDMPAPILRTDVLSMEQLTPGMILQGTVRNVIDFGVFVDIGVHQDGLVHISQICDRFIKHPLEAVSVGDIVKVKVLSVDVGKKRISLSMRDANQ